MAGHADAEARRSVLTALQCATLVALTVLHVPNSLGRVPRWSRASHSPSRYDQLIENL